MEDCLYYNMGNNISGITADDGVSVTSENGAIKITTSASGEKNIYYPPQFDTNSNFEYEVETVTGGDINPVTMIVKTGSTANGLWLSYVTRTSLYEGGLHGITFTYPTSYKAGDKLRVIRENGTTKIYLNDILMNSASGSFSGTFKVGHYTNNGRIQYIKNIKIKA